MMTETCRFLSCLLRLKPGLLLGMVAISGLPATARGIDMISASEGVTAVSSKVFSSYQRSKNLDGSYRPETYAFGNGGFIFNELGALDTPVPTSMRDDTIDDIGFATVARMIEGPLADQKYLLSRDPNRTDLLIMVFWGLTVGGINASGPDKDKINLKNAALLGFDSEGVFSQGFGYNIRSNILKEVHDDVMNAIEPNRYYVVLRAFDFQCAWKQKKIKLLWETRFSLTQRQHDFAKDLPIMAETAGQFFGQDTHGLINKILPSGRVEIGNVKSLGEVPEKPNPDGMLLPAER